LLCYFLFFSFACQVEHAKQEHGTERFHDHLLGTATRSARPYQDTTINSLTKFIHGTCSEYLHNTSQINYQISPYTLKSLINALMEVILWSKNY
jgi:hypothetical protein